MLFMKYVDKKDMLNTSDATATPEDILKDKTAYVKDEKVTGTHECSGGGSSSFNPVGLNLEAGYYATVNGEYVNISNIYKHIERIDVPVVVTSSITTYLFADCIKLKYIKSVDASTCTSLGYMFYNCKSLEEVPPIKTLYYMNVTATSGMFQGCESLKSITPPLLMSYITMANSMFQDCKSLETAPDMETTKMERFKGCFSGCTNLKNVPVYITSNLVDTNGLGMKEMFLDCPNLTDESLNNILTMCTNATKITTAEYKTLKHVGLSQEQATRCTTLSNYSAFTSRGWTTGY